MVETERTLQALPTEEREALDRIRRRSEIKVLRLLRSLAPLALVTFVVVLLVRGDVLHWSIAVPGGIVALWLWNTFAVRIEEVEVAVNGLRRIVEDKPSPKEPPS
jgi:hypothetical protein